MGQTTAKTKDAGAVEQARIDFKMVTFTLAGKDYAIDIMKVKEISKASKFTFVPNAAPFVTGVYNLRGDIISVIDFRRFFNLPVEDKEADIPENMIILRLEDHVLAVIVDTIDKVVGISSDAVQPPHPLFGDINIKYISGVVENDGRLYVILDVERIFGNQDLAERTDSERPTKQLPPSVPKAASKTAVQTPDAVGEDVDIGFIEETLVTFLSFHASSVNRHWIRNRFPGWKKSKGDGDVQLSSVSDAESFLQPFASPSTGTLWSRDYVDKVASFLDPSAQGNFNVWNPGCGGGQETYSVACMVKRTLPAVHLRILGHDNDLIRISAAPGLTLEGRHSDDYYDQFLVDGSRGLSFSKEIKDSILFEYHDITHDNTLPKLDLVVMRDTVSYLHPERQNAVFSLLDEVMKSGGILVLGQHELPTNIDAWTTLDKDGVRAYKKK